MHEPHLKNLLHTKSADAITN